MNRWAGKVGYSVTSDSGNGIWTSTITERQYYGDILKNSRRWTIGENVNRDINIENKISIVADPYALNNLHNMVYVTWQNTKWNISSVEIESPRLILSIGGVYNGQ